MQPTVSSPEPMSAPTSPPPQQQSSLDWLRPLWAGRRRMAAAMLAGALAGAGVSLAIRPTFVSTTTFLPPQQQQSSMAGALASLGALAGIAGSTLGGKSPAEQYVSLMQSNSVIDRLIDRFKLAEVYDTDTRKDTRKTLQNLSQISLGKKDGLIAVTVEDTDPKRAAEIANQYVEELRRVTGSLAMTEAQQRRVFFEGQMQETKQRLTRAQSDLQASGFSERALRSEPKATAERYAQLKATATAAEVRLQALRRSLTDNAPEVQQQVAAVETLHESLRALQQQETPAGTDGNFVSRYREFKYQEAVFELMAKQYEVARMDEAREGALIQVVDRAEPAERRSKPRRSLITAGAAMAAGLLMALYLIATAQLRR